MSPAPAGGLPSSGFLPMQPSLISPNDPFVAELYRKKSGPKCGLSPIKCWRALEVVLRTKLCALGLHSTFKYH